MLTTELVTCSQTTRRPSLSIVIPLPWLDGLATSVTPESGSQRRRTSPGMSLKSRKPSGFQIGPSVKVKPVPSCSTSAPSPTSSGSASGGAPPGGDALFLGMALGRFAPADGVRRAVQPRNLAPDELGVLALPAVGGD